MLSLIINKIIDDTKQIKINENCLNSVLGIYKILKIKIILEMNITVDMNKAEIQSMDSLTEKFVIFLVQIGISMEIKILLLSKIPLRIKVNIDIANKIRNIKIIRFMVPQTIVWIKLIN